MPVAEQQAIQTLEILKEEEIAAPIAVVFETLLEQLGPYNERPDKVPLPMKLEPWPGGRWFRDLGNDTGHWWGNVQAIKPPSLLEISGPLFMSYPAISNVQYRLSEENGVTKLKFAHREGEEILRLAPRATCSLGGRHGVAPEFDSAVEGVVQFVVAAEGERQPPNGVVVAEYCGGERCGAQVVPLHLEPLLCGAAFREDGNQCSDVRSEALTVVPPQRAQRLAESCGGSVGRRPIPLEQPADSLPAALRRLCGLHLVQCVGAQQIVKPEALVARLLDQVCTTECV